MWYPWIALHDWKPFGIDALGLVTLLGAEEINACVGRLVPSRWLEYMPLLAGFVIAGDRFKIRDPSFHLYNISSGINTSDLSSWLTRWMLAQNFEKTSSIVYWDIAEDPRTWWYYHATAFIVSFLSTGLLVVMAVLSRDWYGLANSIAIIISIIVRACIMQANRNAIDKIVKESKPADGTYQAALAEWNKLRESGVPDKPKPSETIGPNNLPWKHEHAKVVIVMSDSKVVTMFIPEQLIIKVFVEDAKPIVGWLYQFCRWVGWMAFAVHIIALGMTKLASQMYTVALLVVPTVLICWRFGCDDSRWHNSWKRFLGTDISPEYVCWIGSRLRATVFEWPDDVEFEEKNSVWSRKKPVDGQERIQHSKRRQDLYAWLNLTVAEETSLAKWDFFPHARNDGNKWTDDFNAKKLLIQNAPTNVLAVKDAILAKMEPAKPSDDAEGKPQATTNDTENPLQPQGPQRTNTNLTSSGMAVGPPAAT